MSSILIKCPFVTTRRLSKLLSAISDAQVTINTKNPLEVSELVLRNQAIVAIDQLQNMGVTVLFTAGHHRKLSVIDKTIVWEGSLNILSQNDSCEIMRRIKSKQLAVNLINFLLLD
jgi:hypothetical protein